ncbi:hypothetical protein [Phytomonospora endophytica]|uniref:Uncharacterized protein n=1 Tax=Phytomonospora endophytica TaxID=714109 RepID=A0A841FDM8_9ACTN|nr:hypothetical protein [Phytomonospora endophytica]MBB6035381.1 hypothetical protein [Phytomonospora endophytica]GIG63867.1 hypothetical protein Pen01_01620 [Phytomonospora endophytica]
MLKDASDSPDLTHALSVARESVLHYRSLHADSPAAFLRGLRGALFQEAQLLERLDLPELHKQAIAEARRLRAA